MNTLEILGQDKINPAFIKANGFLVEKYKIALQKTIDKNLLLKELWLKEFKSELETDGLVFIRATFADSEALTMFLLRWS